MRQPTAQHLTAARRFLDALAAQLGLDPDADRTRLLAIAHAAVDYGAATRRGCRRTIARTERRLLALLGD